MIKKELTPLQKKVMFEKATEHPFTGKLLENKESGDYLCANCRAKLFPSSSKFDSGTGWPSFDSAFQNAINFKEDDSLGMQRTEVICAKCNIHLGHLFNDGPTKTGKRFCINDCTLNFNKKGKNNGN